jgi:hypothetical protein
MRGGLRNSALRLLRPRPLRGVLRHYAHAYLACVVVLSMLVGGIGYKVWSDRPSTGPGVGFCTDVGIEEQLLNVHAIPGPRFSTDIRAESKKVGGQLRLDAMAVGRAVLDRDQQRTSKYEKLIAQQCAASGNTPAVTGTTSPLYQWLQTETTVPAQPTVLPPTTI